MVLIGFSVDVSGLPTSDVQLLLHLGFVLVPAPSEGDRLDPNPAFPPLPPSGFVDPDLPRPVLVAGDRLDPSPAFPPLPPSGFVDPDLARHVHAAQLEVLAQGPLSAASSTHQVPLSPAQAHMAQAPTSDRVKCASSPRKKTSLVMKLSTRSLAGAQDRPLNAGTVLGIESW